MSPIDVLLLSAVLFVGGWRAFAPDRGRRARPTAVLAVGALAVAQLVLESFYWHLLPAYAVLLLAGWPAAPRRPRLRQAGLIALMLAALVPWAVFLPVPQLPAPAGPYAVGTQVFRWVDASRPEDATADPADRRNVVVQAWYPAAAGARGPGVPYLDGLATLRDRVSVFPHFVVRRYDRIDIHAVRDAPPAAGRKLWPVIVFSPGYGAPRAFYTGLVADLASRGFVVLVLDHPYEAAVTQLADGRIVTPARRDLGSEADRIAFMERQVLVRVADVRFVLDRLATPGAPGPILAGRLDLSRLAVAGHSFGGATAALAAGRDPRIRAAVNLDGGLYGGVWEERLPKPYLFLEADRDWPDRDNRNAELIANAAAPGWRFTVGRANHFTFTDTPLFLSPPGRWVVEQVIGGARGAQATERATADIMVAFLTGGDVDAAAARHIGVKGGRAN